MNTDKGNTCRESHHKAFTRRFIKTSPPFLGLTLLSFLPAIFYGCSKAAEASPPASVMCRSGISLSSETNGIKTLDIFVFNDDILQKLDCYQRFDDMDEWNGSIVSSNGKRIITAVANTRFGRMDWAPMSSRFYLQNVSVRLEDERRESASMTGEIRVHAGKGTATVRENMVMYPIASEVRLNSISCDFTGKPYAGEKLSEVRVYLTNVNAECAVIGKEDAPPERIINAGGLCEYDLEGFIQPDIIMQEIKHDIGKSGIHPGISLWCYRSNYPEETPGTPYTRLVIEGKIEGHTYYWPVNVNRETDEEAGIWRNRSYTYDIRITGKGSTDPDIPVKTDEIAINQEVTKWEEIGEYGILF